MTNPLRIALPTADRPMTQHFYDALGFETPGEPHDDGVPEPLQVVVNDGAWLLFIPPGGFGWVTAGRETAAPEVAECLLSHEVGTEQEVDELVERARTAGGTVASEPEQRSWGYAGVFADPDGHLWQVICQPPWS
jgi:predicted lactoylglutathione lyase